VSAEFQSWLGNIALTFGALAGLLTLIDRTLSISSRQGINDRAAIVRDWLSYQQSWPYIRSLQNARAADVLFFIVWLTILAELVWFAWPSIDRFTLWAVTGIALTMLIMIAFYFLTKSIWRKGLIWIGKGPSSIDILARALLAFVFLLGGAILVLWVSIQAGFEYSALFENLTSKSITEWCVVALITLAAYTWLFALYATLLLVTYIAAIYILFIVFRTAEIIAFPVTHGGTAPLIAMSAFLTATGGVLKIFAAPASQEMVWCTGKEGTTSELKILGCSGLIETKRYKGRELAAIFANRGGAYSARAEYDRALADLSEAITLDQSATTLIARGIVYDERKEYDLAIADFSAALDLSPGSIDALLNRGIAYRMKKEYDHAIADFSEAIGINPTVADAFFNRGAAYSEKKDYEHAIADYTQAISINPGLNFALLNRGSAYANRGNFDRAIVDYDKVLELDPKNDIVLNYRGRAYKDKGEYDRAIADYNRAVEINPTNADTFFYRGNVYLYKREYDRAIADYNKAISLDPSKSDAIYNRGVAYKAKAALKPGSISR
jgi:tetratricopeptide (TPR) repeat protein